MSAEYLTDSNGVRYVPEHKVSSHQIDVMKSVFEEYLSSKLCEEAINNFVRIYSNKESSNIFEELLEEDTGHSKSPKSLFSYNATHKFHYNIGSINERGDIFYVNHRKARFNIQKVIKIKNRMTNDMTNMDVRRIAKDVNINREIVGKIMYNLEHGTFDEWINRWKELNTPTLTPKRNLPVQNNPEKRKEMGYGGIP